MAVRRRFVRFMSAVRQSRVTEPRAELVVKRVAPFDRRRTDEQLFSLAAYSCTVLLGWSAYFFGAFYRHNFC